MEFLYYWAGIVLLGIAVLALIQLRRKKFTAEDQEFFAETWQRIETMEPRHAVMEADALLDKALKKLGYNGSLGEKLKKAKTLFSDYRGVWYAHKIRNKVAHEVEFRISDHEAKRACEILKQAYRDLGILM